MTARELAEKIETLDKQAPDGPIRYDVEGCSLDAHNDAVCMFHSAVEHERAIALVSLRNLAPDIVVSLRAQADEIKRLAEGIMLCIDASWRPNEARDWGRPELILGEYVGKLHDEIDALNLKAVPSDRGPDGAPGSPCLAAYLELRDEIARLKAEAIVQGSHKLDEAAKVALRRETIKAAWVRITGSRGWLSGVDYHDGRCACALLFKPNPLIFCTCGADDFRRLMEGDE